MGSASRSASAAEQRHLVAARRDEDDAVDLLARGQVGGDRDEVEVDTDAAHDEHAGAGGVLTDGSGRKGVAGVAAGRRGGDGPQRLEPDERGVRRAPATATTGRGRGG